MQLLQQAAKGGGAVKGIQALLLAPIKYPSKGVSARLLHFFLKLARIKVSLNLKS